MRGFRLGLGGTSVSPNGSAAPALGWVRARARARVRAKVRVRVRVARLVSMAQIKKTASTAH